MLVTHCALQKKKKAPSSNVREAKGAESRAAEGRRELCQRDAALSWQQGTSAAAASLRLLFFFFSQLQACLLAYALVVRVFL